MRKQCIYCAAFSREGMRVTPDLEVTPIKFVLYLEREDLRKITRLLNR